MQWSAFSSSLTSPIMQFEYSIILSPFASLMFCSYVSFESMAASETDWRVASRVFLTWHRQCNEWTIALQVSSIVVIMYIRAKSRFRCSVSVITLPSSEAALEIAWALLALSEPKVLKRAGIPDPERYSSPHMYFQRPLPCREIWLSIDHVW